MNIKSSVITAFRALGRNRMRSALTSVGIIIGVSSVIVMVGMGNSAQVAVRDKIYTYGANAIRIDVPKGKPMRIGDLENLKRDLPQIKYISPVFRKAKITVKFRNRNMEGVVYGVNNDFLYMKDRKAVDGRLLSDDEVDSMAKVAIIGKTNQDTLFAGESSIGTQILIDTLPLKVIGVLDTAGVGFSGEDYDNMIVIPHSTARTRIFNSDGFHQIYVSTGDAESVGEVADGIQSYLRRKHHLRPDMPDDFKIFKSEDKLKVADDISRALSFLLAGIASISLFVGGVGIMNIMLVSVTERTREIGIRMAIGAKRRDIMAQFLIESVTLSSIGGIIGITLGLVMYLVIVRVADWPFIFSFLSIIVSVLFAAGVGMFFGYYPSKKAASLKPIEALKYE
jgi:putative ABC transport system permease protein